MCSVEGGCKQHLSVNGVRHWGGLESAPTLSFRPCSSDEDSPSWMMCFCEKCYVIGRKRSRLLFVGWKCMRIRKAVG